MFIKGLKQKSKHKTGKIGPRIVGEELQREERPTSSISSLNQVYCPLNLMEVEEKKNTEGIEMINRMRRSIDTKPSL